MKSLHRMAVLVTVAIVAGVLGVAAPAHSQPLLHGNLVEFGRDTEMSISQNAQVDRPLLRFATGTALKPGPSLMEIAQDGSVEFFYAATIDFAGFVPANVLPTTVRGWIAVRVAGEYVLIPAFGFIASAAPGGER